MTYSYAFEAKSIQQYLFVTGRLKDVIAASERLDLLVDESEHSVLYHVLQSAGLNSNIVDGGDDSSELIRFTRCKGGAFYALCDKREPLKQLRALWTLTVQQLFPGLKFVDALGEGRDANQSIGNAMAEMATNRDIPNIQLPVATTIMQRARRTGAPSVVQTFKDKNEPEWDLDTDRHRQAYRNLDFATHSRLQQKFTPEHITPIKFPTNLDEDFWFNQSQNKDSDDIKDLAIIHIDGNGLGALLRKLQQALAVTCDDHLYCRVWRQFSQAVANATMEAAQAANDWLFNQAKYQHKGNDYIPMRPLIMGGDDITLLCHADWALEWACKFCQHFKQASQQHLATIHKKYLRQSGINNYLTASGGVLYHKAGHAFTLSHRLVEDLTLAAKTLSKSVSTESPPAALAFFRLSTTSTDDFATVKQRFAHFEVSDKNGPQGEMSLSLAAYLVDGGTGEKPSLNDLKNAVALLDKPPMTKAKWRQMAGLLALGNKTEADAIYARAIERCNDSYKIDKLKQAFKKLSCQSPSFADWYWHDGTKLQTVLSDLLTVAHFTAKGQK